MLNLSNPEFISEACTSKGFLEGFPELSQIYNLVFRTFWEQENGARKKNQNNTLNIRKNTIDEKTCNSWKHYK